MIKMALYLSGVLLILLSNTYAEDIKPGEYKTGYLRPGESHQYIFDANDGDVVTVLIGDINDPFPGSSGSGFWPQIELVEPNGARTSDWGWDSAEINVKLISSSGKHQIIASENKGTVAGWYGLSMVKNPGTDVNDPEDDPVPILPGEYKEGYTASGDLDGYSFYANEGDVASILMGDVNDQFSGSSGSGFWPQVELIEPNGTRIWNWSWDSARIEAEVINESGTYLIIARENKGNKTCAYGLSLSLLQNPGIPTILSLNDEPDPVYSNGTLTLTALGVSDPDGLIVQVDFYRDLNSNGYLDLHGPDQLLGSDTDGQDGWSWSGSIGDSPPFGLNTYFARAKNNSNLWSDPASTTGEILEVIPGDINHDGYVNCDDVEILVDNFGSSGCSEPTWCNGADIDQNGIVDSADMEIIIENWTQTP